MPGLYCPSSWTPLPLTDSWVRACANGPCLSLRARLTYHNPQPQPVDGEARAGAQGGGQRKPSKVRHRRCPPPAPGVFVYTRWPRPKWFRASRRRPPDGASPSSCRAGAARRTPAAARWAPRWGPQHPAAVRRVSPGRFPPHLPESSRTLVPAPALHPAPFCPPSSQFFSFIDSSLYSTVEDWAPDVGQVLGECEPGLTRGLQPGR